MTDITVASGFFAKHAREYEENNLAVFPLRDKRPVVKNPASFGPSSWRMLSSGLLEARGLGMWCGKRNGITVVDFDTHDRGVMDEFIRRAGDTPIKVQTASGKMHLWYSHNGEKRCIRPIKEREIDILGDGVAVLPPTVDKGSSYSFIEGGLSSLWNMPTLLPEAVPESVYGVQNRASMIEGDGRNNTLWRDGMKWAASTRPDSYALLENAIDLLNDKFAEPLPIDELESIAESIWSMTISGKNKFGRQPVVEVSFETLDSINSPDALQLYITLRRAHFGLRPGFAVAIKAITARTLPWSDCNRTRRALRLLVDRGLLILTRPATHREPAFYAFTTGHSQ
jgi:hypothetical protein